MKFKKINRGAFVTVVLLKVVMLFVIVAFVLRLAESIGV